MNSHFYYIFSNGRVQTNVDYSFRVHNSFPVFKEYNNDHHFYFVLATLNLFVKIQIYSAAYKDFY